MKFRLDSQHYINDRLLEPGHIVGDQTDVPFVDAEGESMKPSMQMTPLDGEAKSLFEKTFPTAKLSKNALDNISLKVNEDGQVQQPGGGPGKTLDDQPGSYVLDADGKPTKELKKGLPDSGSPNHPVGQPVIGTPSAAPHIPPKAADDHGQPPGAPLKSQQGAPAKPSEPSKKV